MTRFPIAAAIVVGDGGSRIRTAGVWRPRSEPSLRRFRRPRGHRVSVSPGPRSTTLPPQVRQFLSPVGTDSKEIGQNQQAR